MHLHFIAGEISGDAHAAGLIRELRLLRPDLRVTGLGGPKMQAEVREGIHDWVQKAGVVGLWEVLKMYGFFKEKMDQSVSQILKERPMAVVLVDYPGFNLRLAKALRERGYCGKLIYYISPQVWAWKKGRVKIMAKVLDLMICIFPFEQEFYEKSGLPTVFGGHPMVDRVLTLRREGNREPGLVGWFPGSRRNEVKKLLPILLGASQLLRQTVPDTRFVISAANETLAAVMQDIADQVGMPEAKGWIEIGTVYDLMQRCQVGAVASGTATLEAACLGLPYALIYQVNPLTYLAAKMVVRIERIGIVNILAKRDVVKELVQGDLHSESLAQEMQSLLTDHERRQQLEQELATVTAMLGRPGAYRRAAQAVLHSVV
jgi:lipid-A-disaccharide synthase